MIGLGQRAVNWFKSYLYNRRMYTEVNGTLSGTRKVSVGVPQGTVLGPLLYLIYSFDMKTLGPGIFNFADDTSLLVTGKTEKECAERTNELLIKFNNWVKNNKLTINASKTKVLSFDKREPDPTPISLNSTNLECQNVQASRYSHRRQAEF